MATKKKSKTKKPKSIITQMPGAIEQWPIDEVVPCAQNSRTHSAAQVAKIAASIIEFGFTKPILVDNGGMILAGHGAHQAALKLELETIPVIQIKHLSDAQKRAYRIADNQLALESAWDDKTLAAEVAALNDERFDLALLGFNDDAIEALLAIDEQEMPPQNTVNTVEQENSISQTGDRWIMGAHHVICGDRALLQVDIVVRHWQELTGKDATLERTGETYTELANRLASTA